MSGAIPKGFVRPKKDEETKVGDPLDTKVMIHSMKGVEKKVPALHIGWAEKQTLARYIPPPLDEDGVYPAGAQEMWLELMDYLQQDLKHLLSLPHHRFWSQVVYDPGVHECLESYLMNARRSFDDEVLDDFAVPELESVHRLVLLVCLRMATYKESKENHITPAAFGNIIYDNFLFDICKIFDICVLYGHTNTQLITKMVANIFRNQSKYYADLAEAVPTISMAFDNIEKKLGVAENLLPMALSDINGSLTIEDVNDITLLLTDTLLTLQRFLICHLPACKYFHEDTFEIRLSACYERVIPAMTDILTEQGSDPQQALWVTKLMKRIELARLSMLAIFRVIIQEICFEPLKKDKANPTIVGECVEKFLQIMSTCCGEKIFMTDYCAIYPLSDDLELFKQHDGDVTSLNFITDAVSTAMSELGLTSNVNNLNLEESSGEDKVPSPSDTSGMNGYAETGSAIPSSEELSSMIFHVQDLLPDLGEGFIQQCLQYYGYSTEVVINAVLEGSLPPSLVTLDRSTPAIKEPLPPPTPVPTDTEEKTVRQVDYMDRANVYSNDEFDVFSRKEVDHSKIHKGKKVNKFLAQPSDENDRKRLKEIARQYEETGGTSIYEDEFRYVAEDYNAWVYEDEYDDTYDGGDAGNIDVKPESIKRRPGIIGAGRLNTHIDRTVSASESSEEDKSDAEEKPEADVKKGESTQSQGGARSKFTGNKRGVQRIFQTTFSKSSKPVQKTPTPEREEGDNKPKENVNFIENPEDVRRRAEQRRQDAYRNRGYRGREQQHPPGQENGHDNDHHASKPRVSLGSNRNSGKGWRQGQSGDDDNRRFHGGKYKEDTNHGKAQSQHNRNKMTHKNEHKRQGAQAKFNRNN